MLVVTSSEKAAAMGMSKFEESLAAIDAVGPDGSQYAALSAIYTDDPLAEALRKLDPFSGEYRETAMLLYRSLRLASGTYDPRRDELSQMSGLPDDIWRGVPPWSIGDPNLMGEMMICWGHIMRLLDLSPGMSVLEYGSGSGQLVLALARTGIDVSCVDIDQPSLNVVAAQAAAMNMSVKCESAEFGEGFGSTKFDRVIFFEAFHHAWDFEILLDRLADRLKPSGFIVFCGEPIVTEQTPAIPFPWGPRLDGLSVYCMRKFGWMELGFTREFFFQLLHRHGWLASEHHMGGIFRASAYVAMRASGRTIFLGDPSVIPSRYAQGWSEGEGSHRWTVGDAASFPHPSRTVAKVRLSNYLPVQKNITVQSGNSAFNFQLDPGKSHVVELPASLGGTIDIHSDLHRPKDVIPGSLDERTLGIAVETIEFL